ncbi:hypothetical protein E7T09_09350 [Deinococcus sp. KSM4-11]|uniref:alkaline phosphatase family protein n=1 Tax=Deinococcus sp. KSM4-11 TaxID=2568654 RepID=UPI0010A535A1|nr:alkaline phosphatase family protein [Deinococcus sp. KSM4-11]THF87332.1 hypothetical protein E7T09_09350 [Deinococcus sp. KSM4-11]
MKPVLTALALAVGLSAQAATSSPVPFDHVFLIVLENTSYAQAIGNPNLPTLNALARTYGLATTYTGVAHPSLPNYVAMISGSTFGSVSDDPTQRFAGDTLPLQLERAGLDWKGYFQGLPSTGWDGGAAGAYGKKHNPFMLSAEIAGSPARRAKVVSLDPLQGDLTSGHVPAFSLIVPDVCHDLHGAVTCPPGRTLQRAGDRFVKTWTDAILASPAWTGRSAIVITFDEGSDDAGGGGTVATVVVTTSGPRGVKSRVPYNHYSLLRTLEDAWGLPPLRQAAQATPMTDLFGP